MQGETYGFSLRVFWPELSEQCAIEVKAAALNPADHKLRALPVKSYSH